MNRRRFLRSVGTTGLEIADRLSGRSEFEQIILPDDKAKDVLIEKGFDPQYGARPMRRAVERHLEDPLAEEILKGNLHEGDPVQVSAENGKLTFKQTAAAAGVATTAIGLITAEAGVTVTASDGRPIPFARPGYDHF